MTKAVVVQTQLTDSRAAGEFLGTRVMQDLGGMPPGVLVVFASSQHNYGDLLEGIQSTCTPAILAGCSSAGEFTSGMLAEGSVSALALQSDSMQFSLATAQNVAGDPLGAATTLSAALHTAHDPRYPYRYALVLADALAGYTDTLMEHLTRLTGGSYQFFGGGAGDDANFAHTHVFVGTEAISDAIIAVEMLSAHPFGIGVRHGWRPASDPMRVTEADGTRLASLNAVPAVEMIEEYAEQTGQTFDRDAPVPFFLHNALGIQNGDDYKLRVPLAVQGDGSLICASDTPEGAITRIMGTDAASATAAAAEATEDAMRQLHGAKPEVALFFDCVATRLRIGGEFGKELESVQRALGDAPLVGCNTYGQIARSDGQFSGFHNCTAVVCVIPQ